MLHLEIVGSSPRVNLPLKIGYVDKPPASAPAATFSTRVVRVPFHRRGLTRTPHPDDPRLLDSVDEAHIMPPQHLDHFHNQVSSVYTTPASSERSSPTAETHSTLTPSQGGWDGNDTERSSLDSSCSWDEFDRQAAKTVNHHLDEINKFLYREEGSEKASSIIRKECQDWTAHFLHLRILGKQVIVPQDVGYREYPRDSPRLPTSGLLLDVTDNDITTSSDSQGLFLTGRVVKPMKAPVDATSTHPDYAHLMEDVFDQDGVYEEVIAIDYKDIHEDSEHKKQIIPRRRRIGYPPITPNACVKDSAASSVFDCMWNEIIAWMRPLLKEYSSLLSDSKQELVPTSTFQMSSMLHDPGPSTRESSYLGMLHKNLPPYGITRAHTITATTDTNRSIQELLQINSITLNPKNRTAQDTVDSSTTLSSKRPASKTQNRFRQKLAPIPNRSQTPMAEDMPANVLHVKSITFQKNVSLPYQRHTAVPPLAYDIQQDKATKRKNSSVRASSAIDNKDVRNWHHFNRERQPIDPRPSTTHAMRSDTPLGSTGRRSSTPLSYNKGVFHGRKCILVPQGRLIFNRFETSTGSKSLGITGNSLQHPTELAHLIEDEGMEDSPLHNQWPLKTRTRTTVRT